MAVYDLRKDYLPRRDRLGKREIVTPEGIPLEFAVASGGDRASAFLLDYFIIMLVTFLIALAGVFATGTSFGSSWVGAFVMLFSFFLRNGYFIYFELRWQGSTPGKRRLGIRVIDSNGGVLSASAVFARNLTREVEVFLPMTALIAPEMLWPSAPAGGRVVASIWFLICAFMPLFNSHRLRIGDMVGGTMVVLAPKAVLLEDLGRRPTQEQQRRPTYRFTRDQLDIYGVYELQVLENVLRGDKGGYDDFSTLEQVCEKIKRKIGWERKKWSVNPEIFLKDFYAAQRGRLEQKMLFGKRQEFKKR
jgi:uncharacterized RDD family membrane protein YckC